MLNKIKRLLSEINLPVAIVVIAAVWLVVGFALLASYKYWEWEVLLGFATWILAAAVFFAVRQIYEGRKSTNAQIAMSLFSELRNSEAIEKLRHVYALKPDGLKYVSIRQKEDIDYVLDRLDTLGNLVFKGVVDKELAIETYGGPPALRFWWILKKHIRRVQDRRGYYGENFEAFVRLSLDYFRNKDIEVKFHPTDKPDEGEDLVVQLAELVEKQKNAEPEDKLYPRLLKEIEEDRKKKVALKKKINQKPL